MQRPTIVLGQTEDGLLSSILSESLIQGIGASIVAEDVAEDDLERAVAEKQADVVVLEVADWELPATCKRVLRTSPRTVIVGLNSVHSENAAGREVRILVLYSGEADPHQFVDTMIAALQRSLQTMSHDAACSRLS